MKQVKNFTQGPILKPLLLFAMPVLGTLFLQFMYGAVDLMVVGQFSSAEHVSAVSTGTQFTLNITIIINSLAMGLTIFLGQYIGRGEAHRAGHAIGSGVCMFFIIGIALSIILPLLAPRFATWLNTPDQAFDHAVAYIRICTGGSLFIVAYNLLGSIFRGIGDSKMPLITVLIACICNITGDIIFVAVFKMGAEGAAIATVLAQIISVILSIVVIIRRGLPFPIGKKDFRLDHKIILSIVKIGAPVAVQEVLVGISFLVITSIVNSMGLIASAGVGVAEKLCSLILLVPDSFMQAMSAFVAQNMGANQIKRARKALLCGMFSALPVCLLMSYLSLFHGNTLASFFSADSTVVAAAAQYMKAYSIDILFVGFLFCFIGYFNGCKKTIYVMLQGIAAAFLVRIPLAFAISKLSGITLFHIGLATPTSSAFQLILAIIYFALLYKQQNKQLLKTSYTDTNKLK